MAAKSIKAGEFTSLYDQYVRRIYNFIYYKTHHKETAEDLTSQTFLKALEHLESFDAKKGKFSTWLYQIARNTVIDFYRQKRNLLNIEDVWDLSDEQDLLADLDTKYKLEKVKKYLKVLDPRQREIVVLRVWEELSYKEISEIVERDEGQCRVVFSRALQKLKEEMPSGAFLAFLLLGGVASLE